MPTLANKVMHRSSSVENISFKDLMSMLYMFGEFYFALALVQACRLNAHNTLECISCTPGVFVPVPCQRESSLCARRQHHTDTKCGEYRMISLYLQKHTPDLNENTSTSHGVTETLSNKTNILK